MRSCKKPFIDEYDFVDPEQAVCPECFNRLLLVDEEDEIYFCPDNDMNKGCGWSGKFCQLHFKTGKQK